MSDLNSNSIKSKVPGEQEFRGVASATATDIEPKDIGNKDDFVLTPVMNITKEEMSWTKGGMKLQKVIVCGETSNETTTVTTTISVTESTGLTTVQSTETSEVRVSMTSENLNVERKQYKDEDTKSNDNEHDSDSKKTTKIPKLKLRRALDKIKREDQISRERTDREPNLGMKVRSAIPRLKDVKHPQNNQEDLEKNKENPSEKSQKLDDEFDKLYEETIETDVLNKNRPISEQFDELSKIETKFEEIIHTYDDNKVEQQQHTVVTEKVKSKIPLLKRKSEQEIEIRPQTNRRSSLKKSISNDGKNPVATTKDKTIKTNAENSNILKNKVSSESYSTLTKSETVSATKLRASESVTKVLTTQTSRTTQEVSISSKENIKMEQNTSTSPKDMPKSIVTSAIHEKYETKASNNSEKASEQVTAGVENAFIDDKNGENNLNNTLHSNKINERESEVNPAKLHVLSENKCNEQSTYTSENMAVIDCTKVTEISKSNVKIQSQITNEVKETIKVSTLKYDNSFDSELKSTHENNKTITLNKNNFEKDIINEACDTKINEIQNITTITTNVNEIAAVTNNKIDVDSDKAIKKATNEVETEEQRNFEEKDFTNIYNKFTNNKTKFESVEISKSNLSEDIAENNNQLQRYFTDTNSVTVTSNISTNDNMTQELITEIKQENTHDDKNVVINKENAQNTEKTPISLTDKEEKLTITILEKNNTNENVFGSNELSLENNLVNNNVKIDTNEPDEKPLTKLSSQMKNIELEEEDIIILKGKVNRIISRLDSREQQITKTDLEDMPKDISVTSKIATFENVQPKATLHEDSTDLDAKVKTNIRGDKPKIVDEILKVPNNGLDINHNKQNSNTFDNKTNNNSLYNSKTSKDSIKDFGNQNPFDYNIASNNNQFNSNYYAVYNKVHTSIVNRLNSIERKIKDYEVSEESEKQIVTINESADTINEYDYTNDTSNLKETKSRSEPNFFSNKVQNAIDDNNEVFTSNQEIAPKVDMFKEYRVKEQDSDRRAVSLAEIDLGDSVRGRVKQMVYRMNSMERMRLMRSDTVERKDRLRKVSITDRVAMFEKKVVPIYTDGSSTHRTVTKPTTAAVKTLSKEDVQERIAELSNAKIKYGKVTKMKTIELRDGGRMPVIAVGTALLEPELVKHIIMAAIELGYRAIDTAFIYGNEKAVGEGIQAKIDDGTVTRDELFIMSKLWSTFHRRDLVTKACKHSLEIMGLTYFDLYLIHNPMSFKEGTNPIPKIANVLQYSEHDYLDAWYGIEDLIRKGLVKRGGVSNFNSLQVDRVVEKGKIKPVVNQVESHPYLTQQRLDEFCATRNVKLSCFGVLGSKGTPQDFKSSLPPVIDDPLVQVMSAGLGVTPGQLLIAYQIQNGRNVVVKSSNPTRMWENLQALNVKLEPSHISALNALNRNKRTFTFAGMGDTHRNYPFKTA